VGESEYFVALLPDGGRLVHPIAYGERFPLNYGREVLAELAGVPHRCVQHLGCWLSCLVWGGVGVPWQRFRAPCIATMQCSTSPATSLPAHLPAACRADWKACSASKEEEEARTERFKEAFKPFDIMQ
jgi:hypothetical protein